MKKKFILPLLGIFMFGGLSSVGATPVNSNFTDDIFYSCVIEGYNYSHDVDYGVDHNLTDEELSDISTVHCDVSYPLSNIEGFEKLTSLNSFDFSIRSQDFKTLDLSSISSIKSLHVYAENISNIKIGDNNLEFLFFPDSNNLNFIVKENYDLKNLILAIDRGNGINVNNGLSNDEIGDGLGNSIEFSNLNNYVNENKPFGVILRSNGIYDLNFNFKIDYTYYDYQKLANDILSCYASQQTGGPRCSLIYDLDQSGTVDASDASLALTYVSDDSLATKILKCYASQQTGGESCPLDYDLDHDGKVDASDASYALAHNDATSVNNPGTGVYAGLGVCGLVFVLVSYFLVSKKSKISKI